MLEGFPPRLMYSMIPFGNAYYNTSKCASPAYNKSKMFCWINQCQGDSPPPECFAGKPVCQHGPTECAANLIEACAMHLYPEVSMYSQFVGCWEGDYHTNASSLGPCARYYRLDDKKIEACAANETLARELTVANAKRTLKLGASKLGTPWVLVDGDPLKPEELPVLKQIVCNRMEDPKPKGCGFAPNQREVQIVEQPTRRAARC